MSVCVCVRSGLSTKTRWRPGLVVGSGGLHRRRAGPRAGRRERRAEPRRLVVRDRAGEADDEVAADEVPLVGARRRRRARSLRDRRGRPAAERPYGWPAKSARRNARFASARSLSRASTSSARSRAEARELVLVERGLAEDLRDELDERLEVSANDLRVEADRRRADVDARARRRARRSSPRSAARVSPSAAAAEHARGEAAEAVLAVGIGVAPLRSETTIETSGTAERALDEARRRRRRGRTAPWLLPRVVCRRRHTGRGGRLGYRVCGCLGDRLRGMRRRARRVDEVAPRGRANSPAVTRR